MENIHNFIDELPHKLKLEMQKQIYSQKYRTIKFFEDKSCSFIAWVCPLLGVKILHEDQFLFFDGDEVESLFFNTNGSLGYVLPRFNSVKYIDLPKGTYFGIIDIIHNIIKNNLDINDWISRKEKIKRHFTVKSDE